MLKGKIKLPDRLGSLVVGFEDGGEEEEEAAVLDSGEELETIRPNIGFESDRECDNCGSESSSRPEKESPASVSKAIASDEKRSNLEYELSLPEINLEKLQRIASLGLPDVGGLRATTWKLLLGYLPPCRNLWESELAENRDKYVKLKEELLLSPSKITRRKEGDSDSNDENNEIDLDADGPLTRHRISQEDHPLSLGKSSAWHQYFQHSEITEQIDRDLQRTHPDKKFFSGESPFSKKNRQAMKNILLLFSKLNPEIRYVQGMNEVLAPIFYLFSTDTDEQNSANAEADSFACFVRLLGDSVDHFCQQLDNSAVGILATLSRFSELLKVNDEELWRHLEFTTKDMLLRVCCAMLLCIKSRLLSGDFVANLKLLQHYPDINIEHLLQVARDLAPDTSSYCLSS